MYCKQTFAIIKDETVKNDMVCSNYETANQLARQLYGSDAFAVDSTQYPVSEGDYYKDGVFYFKDGETVIPRNPTSEEQVLELQKQNETLTECILEMSEIVYGDDTTA